MHILALNGDVELDASRKGGPFNILLRRGAAHYALNAKEYTALWQLCGAKRRRGGFPPPPDEIERTRQRLVAEGYLTDVDMPAGFDGITGDHRIQLAAGIDLGSRLFEVLDNNRHIGFLGPFDGLVFELADGMRDVHSLVAASVEHGFQITPAHMSSAIASLMAAQLLVPGSDARPLRRPDVTFRVDAVLVRPQTSHVGFLLGSEEAELVMRAHQGRTVNQLMADTAARTDPDRAWARDVLVKACALGIAVAMPDPRNAAHSPFAVDVEEDRGEPTHITSMAEMGMHDASGDADPLIDGGDFVQSFQPPPVAPAPLTRPSAPQFVPGGMQSASHAIPMRGPSSQMPVMPMRTTPSQPYALPGVGPGAHLASAPGRLMTPASGVPTDAGNMGNSQANSAKLASLAALSLDKNNMSMNDPVPMQARAARSPSKLPWVLLVLVVAGGAYYIKTQKAPAPAAPTTGSGSATVVTPTGPTPGRSLLASGYIAARAPIVLSAKTNGRLEDLKVDTGGTVKKGDVVAQVSDGDAKAQLALANASVRDAQRQMQRIRTLVKAQAATPVELERAIGAVEIAQANARVAAQRLEDTRIRSPIDGTVLEVLVRPGEAISAQQAGVLRIANLNELVAEVNVAENDTKEVYIGQRCEVVSEANRDRTIKGTVREQAQQADRSRGTVEYKVDLEPVTDGSLKPGMAVQVRFMARDEQPTPGADTGSAAGSGSAAAGSGSAAAGSGSATKK